MDGFSQSFMMFEKGFIWSDNDLGDSPAPLDESPS
jgi:hypothetical protein